MHCYQTLAATTLVIRIVESLAPGGVSGMPAAAVADWLESGGIALDDVLDADPATLRAQLAALLDRDLRQAMKAAA